MFCRPPICSCLVVLGALLSLPDLKLSRGCSALCNTYVIPPVSVSHPQLVRKYRCFPAEYHVYGSFLCARCLMRLQFLFLLLFAPAAFAQTAAPDHDMSQMQHAHGGFMQGGMQHEVAKGVILNAKSDAATHI